MKGAAWIIDYLIGKGVTDIFGIPGVVIMDFLYAVDQRSPEITPHLCYHEQGGAYEACGYAQTTGKLGVAYATRGPGFTNMLTAMADAYYDSIPTMFFTAHASTARNEHMRVLNNQEIDTVGIAKQVTKYAVRVDSIADLQREVMHAYACAVSGRKGPVFLDILTEVLNQEVELQSEPAVRHEAGQAAEAAEDAAKRIQMAKRPVILIGNGVRDTGSVRILKKVAKEFKIPVLSSRAGQDIIPDAEEYFGFVGSRATRHSNFILSKADLIIAMGNRMAFPTNSKSFRPIVERSFTVRIEVDAAELEREIPNSVGYAADTADFLRALEEKDLHYSGSDDWLNVCKGLRDVLQGRDEIPVVAIIKKIILMAGKDAALTCDVGNHSFWVTTAYAYACCGNRILYSGSFGALGSALPKAIGAYYAARRPSVCFVGDQGMQFNMQELQLIAQEQLPVTVVILNNRSSGMIMEREKARYGEHLLHTTVSSGYGYPNFEAIAAVYGFEYHRINAADADAAIDFEVGKNPLILELMIEEDTPLHPTLPQGVPCQDLSPALPRELYTRLDNM